MKSQRLIVMSIVRPSSCIHASRDEWELTHVTTPRPSCVSKWRHRNSLREMLPSERRVINGIEVYRKNLSHQASRYLINGKWLRVDEAIAVLEAGKIEAA